MIRAKFYVQDKEPSVDGGGVVKLRPVISGSSENERFYHLTPSGDIVLSTINQAAYDEFELNKEYYVDFTRMVDPPKEALGG